MRFAIDCESVEYELEIERADHDYGEVSLGNIVRVTFASGARDVVTLETFYRDYAAANPGVDVDRAVDDAALAAHLSHLEDLADSAAEAEFDARHEAAGDHFSTGCPRRGLSRDQLNTDRRHMSHFTVLVQISALTLNNNGNDVDLALKKALLPFEESPKTGSPYLEFEDENDTYREEYATKALNRVRMPDGSNLSRYEERFYTVNTTDGWRKTFSLPEGCTEFECPAAEIYPTFEEYMIGYHDMKPDKQTGKYGHWRNPNAKWDWYTIGGRWRGHFPVKPGTEARVGEPGAFDNPATPDGADVVRVSDIDFDRAAVQERAEFEKFKTEYRESLDGKKYDAFDGPRDTAMRLGLVRVEQGPYPEPKANEVVVPWASMVREGDERASWNDVCLRLDDQALAVCSSFFSPLRTYAALDKSGQWHAAGEMGWFGCGSDTPDQNIGFAATFVEKFIRSAGPEDLLVMVDCHI